MKIKNNKFSLIIFFLLALLVFKSWVFLNPLSSGDWGFFYNSSLKEFSVNLSSWNTVFNSGLGGSNLIILGLYFYFSSTVYFLFNFFKFDWALIERIAWFWPFLIISVSSSYLLFKKLFTNKFALFSSAIYLFNTYTLMVVGGGQMGVAMAYSIAPLVLASFIKVTDVILSSSRNIKYAIIAGLLLSLQIIFDLRIAYLTLVAVFVFWILNVFENRNTTYFLKSTLFIFIIPVVLAFLLNAFWIIPTIANQKNPIEQLGPAYSSLGAVKFFSFAKLENSISLLHPNFPENIFGKIGFMKPEFLLLPILAYLSLLFVSKINPSTSLKAREPRTKIYILYFALIGLIGAFLAKGANEPFGGVYLWLFNNFPGFIMFRDPTKWYTLVAVSYSMLIPFGIWKIYEWIKLQSKFQIKLKNRIINFQNLFLLLIIGYFLFLLKPAILGQLSGTFKKQTVPSEYIQLEKYLTSDRSFYRTLWIPNTQLFGYYSDLNPQISGRDFFREYDQNNLLKRIDFPSSRQRLNYSGAKYVVIPLDSEKKIYLTDREYDDKKYQKIVNSLNSISWLKKDKQFGKIIVYKTQGYKDHFWCNCSADISYKFINPAKYEVNVRNFNSRDRLIFSESFDNKWIAENDNFKANSVEFNEEFNSFEIPKGSYSFIVSYSPQKYVDLGLKISISTILVFLSLLFYQLVKERKKV